MKKVIFPMLVLLLTANLGCSMNNAVKMRVRIETNPANQQHSSYTRGSATLASEKHKFELTVLDYSFNEMVVAVSVGNETKDEFLYSSDNIEILQEHRGTVYPVKIYSYDELLAGKGGPVEEPPKVFVLSKCL